MPGVKVCAFCSDDNSKDPSKNLGVHPYVKANFLGISLFLCELCEGNWRDYRQRAIDSKNLLLPGEFNEEICALCSDSPIDDLILCSNCPRFLFG